jgi:predicted DNA-binding transcriptional regulator AlpA
MMSFVDHAAQITAACETMQNAVSERGVQRFVGRAEVADALGVSTKTLDRMVADKRFPRPIQISSNRVGWPVEAVRGHLQSRIEAVTRIAVTDPNKLAPEQIAPALRELGARLISDHIGEAVSPDGIRLLIEPRAEHSEPENCRGKFLEKAEDLFGHFDYWRALLIAAAIFPSIREHLAKEGVPIANNPEELRELAIMSIDDKAWADYERHCTERARTAATVVAPTCPSEPGT